MEDVDETELKQVLASFQKCKIQGLDGLMMQIFHGFFGLLKDDLLKVINESKRLGKVWNPFKRTFIALIPKSPSPSSFIDFCPISYWSFIYKLIAKNIACRLKPIFSSFILEEQYGFLFYRKIHNVVSITKEVLHSLKVKKLPSIAIKLDLSKAFDEVDLTFLHLSLIRIIMNVVLVNWIINCIEHLSHALLINGFPSPSFSSSRGLQQGCPLFMLFFLLIVESLRLMIKKAHLDGALKGLNLSDSKIITHTFCWWYYII